MFLADIGQNTIEKLTLVTAGANLGWNTWEGSFKYVGIGTGMNSLIRPALYGAYHEIVNLSRFDEEATQNVTIVGPICESGDKLGSDRLFPATVEGDVILIANTGAYGRVMASQYNMRKVAPEIVI